jgi:hypothetical protein
VQLQFVPYGTESPSATIDWVAAVAEHATAAQQSAIRPAIAVPRLRSRMLRV